MKKLYPLFIAFFLPVLLYAQNDLVIKGLVTVQANGLLHVEGDVDIQSPSGVLDIQTNGLVKVNTPDASTGLWTCNGSTTGGGDVQFLGVNVDNSDREVDYSVSGSSVSFPNLILNFGGGLIGSGSIQPGMMTLNNNVTVTQTLTLTKGKIVTGSNEIYMADSAANAISGNFGFKKSRYIEGILKRAIKTIPDTTTYYRFPIGSANAGYNAVSVDLRTNVSEAVVPPGVTSIKGEFKELPNIGNINVNGGWSGCYFTTQQQYLDFFWMVHDFGYWDFQPNVTDSNTWNYDFYCFPNKPYLDSLNPGLTHLKIIKAPDSVAVPSSTFDWSPYFFGSGNICNGVNIDPTSFYWYPGEYQALAATDSIAAWDLKSFSRFGLGGGTGAGLPIELLYLKAYPVNNEYIEVAWATETEINNDYFDVLRSTDGLNFTWIGLVEGAGNSSEMLTYKFPDYNVDPNVLYYYRLKQVDFDETFELTDIVTAMITDASTFTISEFIPNPSENDSRIEVVSSAEKDLNITVYNTLGQIVMNGDHTVVAGINTIDFDFNLLADGTYYAIIKADNEFFNRKLILTK